VAFTTAAAPTGRKRDISQTEFGTWHRLFIVAGVASTTNMLTNDVIDYPLAL